MNMPTSHPSGYPCRYFGNPSDAFHKMGRRPGNDRSRRCGRAGTRDNVRLPVHGSCSALLVREDADDVSPPLDLFVEPFERVVMCNLVRC